LKPKILLTGFGPFPGVPVNPTGALMERIAADTAFFPEAEILAVALDTAYAPARALFEKSAAAFAPDAVLSFGVATGETLYRIERIALNLDDCKIVDAAGALRVKTQIAADGPERYVAPFPVAEIEAALRAAQIPVRLSDSAGNYVCNHIFYSACHWAAGREECRAGFIHVPDPAKCADWNTSGYRKTLENAAKLALGVVVADLTRGGSQMGARNTK